MVRTIPMAEEGGVGDQERNMILMRNGGQKADKAKYISRNIKHVVKKMGCTCVRGQVGDE